MTTAITPNNNDTNKNENPTSQLPDRSDAAQTAASQEPAERELLDSTPQLAHESRFKRERQEEQDAAMASLDETLLRPFVLPADYDPAQPDYTRGASQPPLPSSVDAAPHPSRQHSWRALGIVAILAVTALVVGIHAYGSRKSNVGLLGAPRIEEQQASQEPAPVQLTTPVTVERPVSEEVSTEEETPEAESSSKEHSLTWDFSQQRDQDTTSEEDESQQEETNANRSERKHSDDGSSLSLDFDGGNVTYYYNDDYVTLDWDLIDEMEQYLDNYDVWGYGTPGGEQGYGSGYGGRGRERDRGSDYYSYGW